MADEGRLLHVSASKQSDTLNQSHITLEPFPSICPHPSWILVTPCFVLMQSTKFNYDNLCEFIWFHLDFYAKYYSVSLLNSFPIYLLKSPWKSSREWGMYWSTDWTKSWLEIHLLTAIWIDAHLKITEPTSSKHSG